MEIVLIVFCFFIFCFVFWRELKEDYIPSQIFSTALTIGFLFLVAYTLTSYFLKQYRFWFLVFSVILGYIIGSKRTGLKYYEGYDNMVLGALISLVASAVILIKHWGIDWILFYASVVLSLSVFVLIKKNYKAFIWYKSGKRGFSGLFTVGVFFLIRSIISFAKPDFVLSLTEYDMFISGLISFASFLNIFILANK
jgi:hypothetical protein